MAISLSSWWLLLLGLFTTDCAWLTPLAARRAGRRARSIRLATDDAVSVPELSSDSGGLPQLVFGLAKLEASPLHILTVHDAVLSYAQTDDSLFASAAEFLCKSRRDQLLVELLRVDRPAYIETASFLNIPRLELPNLQGVRVRDAPAAEPPPAAAPGEDELVPDCALDDLAMGENLLEAVLLKVTRDIYADQCGIVTRRYEDPGITGLIDEMRQFMLSPVGRPAEKQQEVLLATLLVLMTPVLPPFYRIFMGGLVPSLERGDPAWLVDGAQRLARALPFNLGAKLTPGRQLGPLPYAPLLTALVSPYAFGFLVGPARVNRRSDGGLGGLVVEKCKFLQESNCKGMCLNSCKQPAQDLFSSLGLPLRVSPNFETQECQWSFGEVAPPAAEDPTWPKGCIVGCESRELMKEPIQPADGGKPRVMVSSCV